MGRRYEPADGIERFGVGTPPVLGDGRASRWARGSSPRPGIDRLAAKGRRADRARSSRSADAWLAPHGVRLASPRDPARRGSHVTLAHPQAWQLTQALIDRGVVPDFRTPDRVRLGPAPLYTRFVDVWDAMDRFRAVLAEGAHQAYPARAGPGDLRGWRPSGPGSGTPIGLPAAIPPRQRPRGGPAPAVRRGGRSRRRRAPATGPAPAGRCRPRWPPRCARPSALSSSPSSQPRAVSASAAASHASSSHPRARCSHSRVLRPAAAASTCAATPSISRWSSAALCPSPRCSRSVVSACQSAQVRLGRAAAAPALAAASGRPGRSTARRRPAPAAPRSRPPPARPATPRRGPGGRRRRPRPAALRSAAVRATRRPRPPGTRRATKSGAKL